MDVEKELKLREAELMDKTKLETPTMAKGVVGPQDTPGPKGPVGSQAPTSVASRVVQLDPQTVLRVELLATKKQLAEADERMGLWAVQDARRRKKDLIREESSMIDEVSHQIGAPVGSSIKLVDKARGLCQVE
jgi:hypothetical protein